MDIQLTETENFVIARFKYNEHALEVLNGSGKFAELSATKKRISEMIEENEKVSADAMAASVGVTARAIWNNIKQLKDADIIERRDATAAVTGRSSEKSLNEMIPYLQSRACSRSRS